MEPGMYLTQTMLAGFSEATRMEIAKAFFPSLADDDDWDADVVRLTKDQARDYISNCSAKTRTLLRMLVDNEGELSHHAVRDEFGETAAQLKSAFGGLTKRAKTVVGKKSAKLIQWEQVGGEWIAYLHPTTVTALQAVL